MKRGPAAAKMGKKAGAAAERYYILVRTPSKPGHENLNLGTAVVAKEAGNRIVGYRVYFQR